MNRSEYKLIMSILRTRKDNLFAGKPGQSDSVMKRLIDLGYVERSIALNGNYADRVYVYQVTTSGREAADEYRSKRSERWWTRGLALAAIIISIAALCVSALSLWLQWKSL